MIDPQSEMLRVCCDLDVSPQRGDVEQAEFLGHACAVIVDSWIDGILANA